MKIVSVHGYPYRIPMRNIFTTAHGSSSVREGALVEIQTHNGIIGFGDIAPLAEFGCGTLSDALHVFSEIVTYINAMSIDEALAFLWHQANEYPSSLVSGIELALLDIQGKVRCRPIHQLLLGHSGQSDTYTACKRVSVNTVVGAATLDAAVEEARTAVANGFGCVKLKVGMGQAQVRGDIRGDPLRLPVAVCSVPSAAAQEHEQMTIERIAAVRQAIGPAVHLRLDANEGWSFERAKTILRACEAFDIQYVEQPLPRHDLEGLARLRSVTDIPIAIDEAITNLESARRVIRARAADILIVKPQFARGLRMAQQIIMEAEEQGIQCVLTSAMESGIGVAGVLHLAAALPQITLECGLATLPLLEHDLLTDSLTIDNGLMSVPVGAGLGVQPDMQALRTYRGY